jgi:phage terminase large subunit GpA-like protein|tara:strand:+ start:238 stop:594 length:357 start_codon:yes stop_codon:yes gene_type:complete
MKNETEAICEHCHATGEPKEIFDNGWWWNPHHWKAEWHHASKGLNSYIRSAPRICPECSTSWSKDCTGWSYHEDFPIMGCVDFICPNCSDKAEKESEEELIGESPAGDSRIERRQPSA